MHAIRQRERARVRYGQGRYTLWTGDGGLALFLSDCLDPQDSAFPGLVAQARERPGGEVVAIATPHTWLLAEGWRKAGPRLDPAEVPCAS